MSRGYEEKRDFIRMIVDCKIQINNLATGDIFQGIAQDLSSKGLAFSTNSNIAPGSKLEVRIVPDKVLVPPLHARVEVIRSEPDTTGGSYRVSAHIEEYLD